MLNSPMHLLSPPQTTRNPVLLSLLKAWGSLVSKMVKSLQMPNAGHQSVGSGLTQWCILKLNLDIYNPLCMERWVQSPQLSCQLDVQWCFHSWLHLLAETFTQTCDSILKAVTDCDNVDVGGGWTPPAVPTARFWTHHLFCCGLDKAMV